MLVSFVWRNWLCPDLALLQRVLCVATHIAARAVKLAGIAKCECEGYAALCYNVLSVAWAV